MKTFTKSALIVVAVLASAMPGFAQQRFTIRNGGNGAFMSLGMLVQRHDVQKELNLTDEQQSKLRDIRDAQRAEMQQQMQAAMAQMGNGGGPDDQGREKMMKAFQDMSAKNDAKVKEVLTPDQAKRAGEILIQRMGINAIGKPDVQKDLGMTATQVSKVKDLQKKMGQAMMELGQKMGSGEITQEDFQTSVEKNGKILETELGKVLTAEQKKKLEDMKGKPFEFDKDEHVGFGG